MRAATLITIFHTSPSFSITILIEQEPLCRWVEENAHYFPQPLFEKLNTDPQATIALTEDGKIEAANNAAQSMFGIENDGHIDNLPFEQEGLAKLKSISRKLFGKGKSQPNSSPDLCRLAMLKTDAPLLATLSLWETAGNRRFLILKSAGFVWPDHLSPLVQNAFELTGAEVDVMKLLVQGNLLEEVARIRGSSMATVPHTSSVDLCQKHPRETRASFFGWQWG